MPSSDPDHPPPSSSSSASDTKDSTLYSASPHSSLERQARRAKTYTDPTWSILFVLVVALVYWCLPGIHKPWHFQTPLKYQSQQSQQLRLQQQQQQQQQAIAQPRMVWQKTFTLSSRGRGCHLVTDEVSKNIAEGLKSASSAGGGILTLFIQHTSAGLTLNENFDRDVRTDMDMAFDKIVPENLPWRHTDEGPDDSASHTKATLCGTSVTVPIGPGGNLLLGTWQGVYLCEFRAMKHSRRIVATIIP